MAKRNQELTLIFDRVRFCKDPDEDGYGWLLLECIDEERAKTEKDTPNGRYIKKAGETVVAVTANPDDLTAGQAYRFFGHWRESEKHGKRFNARTFVRSAPLGEAGLIRYLQRAPGIGKATASALVDRFGSDAVALLRTQPGNVAAAADIKGLTPQKAEAAANFLQEEVRLEACTIDLLQLFDGRGFPRTLVNRVVSDFGNRAAELIRRNPYILLAYRGVGFLRADNLYLDLGGNPAKLKRQALCATWAVKADQHGHTWLSFEAISQAMAERISGADLRAVDACKLAIRAGLMRIRQVDDGGHYFAEEKRAANEEAIAEQLGRMACKPASWPAVDSIEGLSEHQAEQLGKAKQTPVAVLTGGPGTGKTYTAAALIKAIQKSGAGSIGICAPSGKAAVRIAEVMAGYGINLAARTIHSTLGVKTGGGDGGFSFRHNRSNPLPFRYLVIDEASMIDSDLGAAIFSALADGCQVLIVGDVCQLPPVGHGAPLRDLLQAFDAAGVPYGKLTEVRRNSGLAVEVCHKIAAGGKDWQPATPVDLPSQNLGLMHAKNEDEAKQKLVKALRHLATTGLANPVSDCQVIIALNEAGELNRKAVNKLLQAELNPQGEVEGTPFRKLDKIVCLDNQAAKCVEDAPDGYNEEANEDGRVCVANGELGYVVDAQPKLTIIRLDAPARLIQVPRGATKEGEADRGSWDLGYAITCHKMQGSECPFIFVMLDPKGRRVCSREWLYTALSRQQKAVIMVGQLETAYAMVDRIAIKYRRTFLAEQLQQVHGRESQPALPIAGNYISEAATAAISSGIMPAAKSDTTDTAADKTAKADLAASRARYEEAVAELDEGPIDRYLAAVEELMQDSPPVVGRRIINEGLQYLQAEGSASQQLANIFLAAADLVDAAAEMIPIGEVAPVEDAALQLRHFAEAEADEAAAEAIEADKAERASR